MQAFKTWLHRQLDELDFLEGIYFEIDDPGEAVESIVQQAADRAARLGLAELYRKSLGIRRASLTEARWYLSECLRSLPSQAEIPVPSLMTAEEVIAYLRLNADERNPTDRLRNLIRRQRLPFSQRGRLLLFQKTAVDEWLQGKQATTMYVNRGRPRHNTNPTREQT